jgi:hypothetical protein
LRDAGPGKYEKHRLPGADGIARVRLRYAWAAENRISGAQAFS